MHSFYRGKSIPNIWATSGIFKVNSRHPGVNVMINIFSDFRQYLFANNYHQYPAKNGVFSEKRML
jgi:hypothetical protein